MPSIAQELTELGFTPSEARVYLNILETGSETGYQIGQDLGLSRSSVYAALDGLELKGAVYLIPGDTKAYRAENPQTLIQRIRRSFLARTDRITSALKDLSIRKDTPYLNIQGHENIIEKTRGLIEEAKSEILINTDFSLDLFQEEFRAAGLRGVRILIFTFHPLDPGDLPVELYFSQTAKPTTCGDHRLMISVDGQQGLLAGREENGSFRGTFSQNPLLTAILAEHIHHDIYLLRLRERYGHDPSEEGIRLNTRHEELSGLDRLKPDHPPKNKENNQ